MKTGLRSRRRDSRSHRRAGGAEGAGLEPELTLVGRPGLNRPSRLVISPSAAASTVRTDERTDDLCAWTGAHLAHLVPYRLAMESALFRKLVVALVFVTVVAAGAASSAAGPTAVALRLDGAQFRPELALTSATRSRGLMNRRLAPADGMLFVFPGDTAGGFWMKNTLVPLRIVFFKADGRRVRQLSMTPCRQVSCPVYSPGRTYRFALELRASDMRPAARLGPLAELKRLVRLAN